MPPLFSDAESFLASATHASTACLVADLKIPGMVTAYSEEVTHVRARKAGINCCLIKPFAAEQLLECIREALATPRRGRPATN